MERTWRKKVDARTLINEKRIQRKPQQIRDCSRNPDAARQTNWQDKPNVPLQHELRSISTIPELHENKRSHSKRRHGWKSNL